MEVIFSELKQKDVINLTDGRHLGRVCDLNFTFPESVVCGFLVTGSKGFKFTRQEIFLPIKSIVKIGEDAVLVNLNEENPPPPPPKGGQKPCPPPSQIPPPQMPPHAQGPSSQPPPQSRRSYDEYE